MARNDTRRAAVGDLPRHPAKYSRTVINAIIREVQKIVDANPDKPIWSVLDPFGGVGGIFELHVLEGDYDASSLLFQITCIEIEHEWAEAAENHLRYRSEYDQVVAGDFFTWDPLLLRDFVITSCTYGNRMADHHEAKDDSERNTYRHKLGRPLSPNNSGAMQWGQEYRDFHRAAWKKVYDCLHPGGYLILNVKDHIRRKEKQPVSMWHLQTCKGIGFEHRFTLQPSVSGNRQGENHEARVDHENIFILQKPYATRDKDE